MIGLLAGFAGKFFGGNTGTAGLTLVALIALGGYIGWLKIDNGMLKNKVESLQNDVREQQLLVETERGNVRTCQARVDVNNQRIEDLKDATKNNQKVIDMLGENIDAFREASNARIENLRDAPTPQSCEEAMQFLREGVGERR